LPEQLASDVESAEATRTHARTLEQMQIKHDLDMAALRQAHELKMDAWNTQQRIEESIAEGEE